MRTTLRRLWPALLLAGMLLVTAVFILKACRFRDDIRFLAEYSPAHWITYPSPAFTGSFYDVPLDTAFKRSFSLQSVPVQAWLRVRAFGTYAVFINGIPVPSDVDPHWKRESCCEVARLLRPGLNDIMVSVTNSSGPPALWLALSSPGTVLFSDRSWESSLAGAAWCPARLATDPVPFGNLDPDGIAERVSTSLLKVWPLWLIFAGISSAVLVFCKRWLSGEKPTGCFDQQSPFRFLRVYFDPAVPHGRWVGLSRLLFALIAVFWVVLFFHNSRYLLPDQGFDASGHLGYIDYLRTKWSAPLPDQGWQMHHPPLYYFLAAVVLEIAGCAPTTANGILGIRLLNLVLAVVTLRAILACLRLIFPQHPRRWIFGLLFAGFLPMAVYLYQYPTNHILACTLATVIFYLVLRILCVPGSGTRVYALLGLAMGLGLLSMVTVGLLVVPVGLAIIAKVFADRARVGWSQAVNRIVILCVLALTVCGWYYVRVWSHFGTPVVANRGAMGTGATPYPWWQDPGFRTQGDYLRFGESLRAPLFSVWNGVWDGLYSTLWGDSYCSGVPSLDFRPPWSYDFMVAGMLFALVPTAAILLGGGVAVFRWMRKPTIVWTFLLAGAFLVGWFLAYGPVTMPCYASVKSFYGLIAIVPLSALAAWGFDLLSGRWRWLRAAAAITLGVWCINVAASYWILPFATETKRYTARQLLVQGKAEEGAGKLQELLNRHPEDTLTRDLLARTLLNQNLNGSALQVLTQPYSPSDCATRHYLMAVALANQNRIKEALEEFQKAAKMAPDNPGIVSHYAVFASTAIDTHDAILLCRNALRVDPFFVGCHLRLAELYLQEGDQQSAQRHQFYAKVLQEKAASF